jgi:cell division protein ZapA (FtsZ GTPase activity inhibitor)
MEIQSLKLGIKNTQIHKILNLERVIIMSTIILLDYLQHEIEKSKSFLALQREFYPEESVSVERAKERLAVQEDMYRIAYGF